MKITTGLTDDCVLQRDGGNRATVTVQGTLPSEITGTIHATIQRKEAPLADWHARPVGSASGGDWTARLEGLLVGGPYFITFFVEGKTETSVTVRGVLVGDLWILAGQSNMEGYGLLEGVEEPDPFVHVFDMGGRWHLAEEPLHWLCDAPGSFHCSETGEAQRQLAMQARQSRATGAGLGLPFAKAMVRETGIPVGLLPVAHGGTSLDQWNPALKEEGRLSLYGFMREQLRSAGGRVCGLLWYQGESDAWDAGTTATYAERFQAFVKNVREDFGWFQAYGLEMPVLWVQLGRLITPIEWGAGPNAWNQIQETQRTLVDSIPNSAMVPAVDLELDDAIHIGRYGLKRLGRRLARVALALLEGHTELPGPRLVQVAVEGENRRCIRVSYSGVADYSFETNHRISGFSVHNRQGEPLEFIYKAEVDVEQPSDILLWLVEPVEPGMTLRYGAGFNPVCTLTDKDDMALPVSGPHEL